MIDLHLSKLQKTWIVDIDGVVFRHNHYKTIDDDSSDAPIEGSVEFFNRIPSEDVVILVTSRLQAFEKRTKKDLQRANIRYDHLIMGLPTGERILINDKKLSGLRTAFSVNVQRDSGLARVRIKRDDR